MVQGNLFANTLDPSQGVEHHDWRREFSEDCRNPTTKTHYFEALGRRLRRIYLPFFVLMLAAWLFKIAAFTDRPIIDGRHGRERPWGRYFRRRRPVLATAITIVFWPRERQAKGEFADVEHGEWKESD